ncbi:MAG: dephospho-CoA kinase [Cellulosilyticaceae bacterium]
MKIIGIVGGIGAGKTTVVSMFVELCHAYIIGADEIGHQILLKNGSGYDRVVEVFGAEILDEEGHIVRSRLGQIVFEDRAALDTLNGISHPLIYSEVKSQIERCKEEGGWDFVVIDAALLIEIGLINLVDTVVGVYAQEATRVARVMTRSGLSEEEAKKRIAAQKPWETFEKISNHVIDNSESYQNTKDQIEKLIKNW